MTRAAYLALSALCIGMAVTQLLRLVRTAAPCGSDPRSRYHVRMAPLREALGGVAYADYLGDTVAGFGNLPADEATGLFFAQHHALPTILRRGRDAALVVVNFHGDDAATRAQELGWRVVRAFGAGLYLMAR